MRENSPFRRNLIIIAILHVLVIGGLYFSGVFSKKNESVTWLEGGGDLAAAAQKESNAQPDETDKPDESTPEPTPMKETEPKHDDSAPSEITLSSPTPEPTATPRPTPKPTPRPTPTPTPTPHPTATPEPTPKPTPKPTPRHTPKPTPKASATPKKKKSPSPSASPHKSASPKPSAKASEEEADSGTPKPKAHHEKEDEESGDETAGTHEDESKGKSGTASSKSDKGSGPGTGGGKGGNGAPGGSQSAAEIGWYYAMIRDKFYSQWQQPSSIVQAGEKLSAVVKIRIEKDGRVTDATLERSSGNAIMDESVMDAAKRVKQIAPLPSAIKDDFDIVPIELELTPN